MSVAHIHNAAVDRLWSLVYAQAQIDPTRLANAMEEVIRSTPAVELDQRTRKLLSSALDALRAHRDQGYLRRLSEEMRLVIDELFIDPLSFVDRGFHGLGKRLIPETQKKTLENVLRLIDEAMRDELQIYIAGSGALLLQDSMRWNTEDIDIVNEVPSVIRNNHALLENIAARYQIQIGHVQSHYLPEGWETRANSFGDFRKLIVFVVDPLDIFIGKLFSKRMKDQLHLDQLVKQFDRDSIHARFVESAHKLMSDEFSRPNAEKNWYVLFGEKLPDVP